MIIFLTTILYQFIFNTIIDNYSLGLVHFLAFGELFFELVFIVYVICFSVMKFIEEKGWL